MSKKKKKTTTTKKVLAIILTVAIIDLQFTYVLAFLGREQIAETLAGILVAEILGSFVAYCSKSFFENKEIDKNKLIREKMDKYDGLELIDLNEEVKG